MSEQQNSLRTIFVEALEIDDAQLRAAFLSRACGADLALRREVEELIRAHAATCKFLPEQPAVTEVRAGLLAAAKAIDSQGAFSDVRVTESPGDRIGRYKLLQRIGEGGCGIVYMAEQEEPVRRRVALKVIKLGMDTKQVVARFEAERQALALMDHPNIAKVFDAGATETGRPYFVMELVGGTKITEYCDQNNVATGERLKLFVQVSQAIQHAHQKGIIHRDIKPSNILVTLHDGVPVPKVIDFGIAKAMNDQKLTDKTLFTAFGQFVGTPAYMSPEQAERGGLDVDTRSDIYSLGVLLYELLTGKTPFDSKELLRAGVDEMFRIIREMEPARPSTRLSTMQAADLATVARQRRIDSSRLINVLKGDLDWIVMRTLEKDRARRYETANGLANDIQRQLNNEPVIARPPSNLYRFQKVVRRNKLAFGAAGAVGIALILGLGLSTWQYLEKSKAYQRALLAEREQSRLREEVELQRAEELFAAGDSSTALAYLARVLRQNPSNGVAAARVLSALTQRSFAIRLTHDAMVRSAQFSPDGQRVVTASNDKTARVWDANTGQPLTEPLKHENVVWSAQFSPDGQRVVTAGEDKTARVWDANTGQPLSEPLEHEDRVRFAQFSPDGQRVVTAGEDKTARVWDANTGQPLTEPLKHESVVLSAQFSPDGQRVVTASLDNTARVWDADTGQPLTEPLRHGGAVHSAEFSPDGQRVVTASWDHTARIWNANTGQPLTEPLRHDGEVYSAEFSPDGQRVVTASLDHTARIWNANTGQQLTEPLEHEHEVWFAQFSPDGQRVVTASVDKTARVWDATTGQPLTEPLKHEGPVSSAQFSPSGQRVVTASWDHTARIWDANMNQPLTEPLRHGGEVHSAEFSPDGQRVVTASWDHTARIRNANTGQQLTEPLEHEDRVWFAQFSPDGQRVVTASADKTARVWDATTGQPLTEPLKHEGPVSSARFSPFGQQVVTASWDHTARIWDANTGQPLTKPLKHKDRVWSAQFSPDGQRVVTASADKTARVWGANTGQPSTESLKHEDSVLSAQFSPDGRRVVTASMDKTARVWDANTGQPLTEPLKHEAEVRSAQFSRDGQRVVTASGDKTARVWDANTGQPLTGPLKHEAAVWSAQFGPDEQRVVTASLDRTARVWDANTGQPLTEPLKHEAEVWSIQFSPDGQRVLTASRDKTARLWDANTGQPLTEPLKHESAVLSAQFSPDGRRVVTASSRTARIWEVPTVSLPVPAWIPKLTQAIAGKRFNDHGISEPVAFAELLALKRQLSESSARDVWIRWAKWFFADPAGRTISPFSDTTVPDYVRKRIEENTLESLQEAVKVAPTNGLALARLARAILAQEPARNPRQVGEGSWFSLRAVKFAPEEAEAWWARAEALERLGNLSEALEAMVGALRIQPQNAELWNAQGRMLEKTNRADEAYQSFSKAIEVARVKSDSPIQAQAKFYLSRSNYLKRQNRLAEAAMDFCLAKNIPWREPQTMPNLIDLSLHYNASLAEKWHAGAPTDLSPLRHGVQTLAGVEFDVRGLIQVGAETLTGEKYPKQVLDIAVGRNCKRLHFLHSAINAFDAKDGMQIGSYVIHYADGQQRLIPLVIGQDLADWWSRLNEEHKPFIIAWKGTNELGRQQGRIIRLFKTTWENPLPEVTVKSIDFVSSLVEQDPFLVAITAE